MIILETNAGLGYNELAYLIKITEREYLCIDLKNISQYDTEFIIGEIVIFEKEDHYYLKESNFDIENAPIFNTFLFKEFIKNR